MTLKSSVTLDKIISTVGELPASPAIVSSLMGLTSNLESTLDDVSRVLAGDQSLTAKVLKLSNSPFYGRPKGVGTLEEAIMILGFFTVRSMVIATSAHQIYSSGDKHGMQSKLWRHSLSTAVASRQIARYIKHPDTEEIFIGALLHDIGKLVLMQQLYDLYHEIIAEVEKTNGSFFDNEFTQLGFTHCDVAVSLLEKWSFPPSLIEAIVEHHNLPEWDNDGEIPISYIINLGNHMAKKMDLGFNDKRIKDLSGLKSAQALSLSAEVLDEIYEKFIEHYQIEVKIIEGK